MQESVIKALKTVAYSCYKKCLDSMYSYEDFYQEGLIIAYQHQHKPPSHIIRIVKSELLMIVRKKLKYFANTTNELTDMGIRDNKEYNYLCTELLEKIDKRYRETFIHLYMLGCNVTDTAKILGITRRTATRHNKAIIEQLEGIYG